MLSLKTSPLIRISLFWAGYLGILALAAIPKGLAPALWGQLVWGAVSVPVLLLLSRWVSSHDVPDSRATRAGRSTWSGLAIGASIGFATYAITVAAVSLLAAGVTLLPASLPPMRAVVIAVLPVVLLAYMEELGFRGYPLRALTRAIGTVRAQLVVAFAFAAVHLLFGWSWQTVLLGVLPSAVLFGAAAARSGGLAMPTGLHAALNLARMATGESGAVAIWTIQVDPTATGRVESMAPWIGAAVTLFVAAAFWSWRGNPRTGIPHSATAIRRVS